MKYYAKLVAAQSKRKKILVEIWKTTPLGGSSYDEIQDYKSFWTLGGAQSWTIKKLLRYNLQENIPHFFITDEMLFRKEL